MGPTWILETGLHAAHMSAAGHLKYETGASVCIGAGVIESLKRLAPAMGETASTSTAGTSTSWPRTARSCRWAASRSPPIAVTGRLPGAVAYQIGDVLFTGDAVLAPEFGRAAATCPAPTPKASTPPRDASSPCQTTPGFCRLGRRRRSRESTVAEQRAGNVQLHDGVDLAAFVAARAAADAAAGPHALRRRGPARGIRRASLPPEGENGRRFPPTDIRSL
jgi:hypothetical protein